jgi:hypothetical protein
MSDKRHPYPVTVVHEVFTPAPEANEALQGFFREEERGDRATFLVSGLYTTARRLLDMGVHRKFHQYDAELQAAKRSLAAATLAGEALRLSGRTGLRVNGAGQGRLYVEIAGEDRSRFGELTSYLEGIGDVGERMTGGDCLYVDIPAEELVQTDEERAYAQFLAQRRILRSPNATVGNPRIVERDVPGYLLKQELPKRKKAYEEVA